MEIVISLSKERSRQLSSICADIAQVMFASTAIPAVFDKFDIIKLVFGLATAFVFWVLSLKLSN